jgi:hypothetical protein
MKILEKGRGISPEVLLNVVLEYYHEFYHRTTVIIYKNGCEFFAISI